LIFYPVYINPHTRGMRCSSPRHDTDYTLPYAMVEYIGDFDKDGQPIEDITMSSGDIMDSYMCPACMLENYNSNHCLNCDADISPDWIENDIQLATLIKDVRFDVTEDDEEIEIIVHGKYKNPYIHHGHVYGLCDSCKSIIN
jgi:hypothetical protein